MENQELKYFKIAKKLNEEFHSELLKIEAHFRGSINSYSLVSLNKKTPEIGINLKKEYSKEELLRFSPQMSEEKSAPEKKLQAWIILKTIQSNGLLPFGENLYFITSELALKPKVAEKRKIVNDILAIDNENNLVVVELKSERTNKVKAQAIAFKKEIEADSDFFMKLTHLMTNKKWNGNVRCVVVWPKVNNKARKTPEEYKDIEEYQYYNEYEFDKISELICK